MCDVFIMLFKIVSAGCFLSLCILLLKAVKLQICIFGNQATPFMSYVFKTFFKKRFLNISASTVSNFERKTKRISAFSKDICCIVIEWREPCLLLQYCITEGFSKVFQRLKKYFRARDLPRNSHLAKDCFKRHFVII